MSDYGWDYDQYTSLGECGVCGRRWESCRCAERRLPAYEQYVREDARDDEGDDE